MTSLPSLSVSLSLSLSPKVPHTQYRKRFCASHNKIRMLFLSWDIEKSSLIALKLRCSDARSRGQPRHRANGACAHYVMVSKFQWKPFWLATQRDPQNDWAATQNRVNHADMTYSHRPHLVILRDKNRDMRRSKWRKREFLKNQVDFQQGFFSFWCVLLHTWVLWSCVFFSSSPAPETQYLCHL